MKWLVFLVPALLLGSLSSCKSFDDYCMEESDCHDGNEFDTDACIARKEAESDKADLYGCEDFFDTFQECLEQEATCNNDVYVLEGNDCDDESREYSQCMSG